MTLFECEICQVLSTEMVCDRCHTVMCQEFEDEEVECRQERHYIPERMARASQEYGGLYLQLDNPL